MVVAAVIDFNSEKSIAVATAIDFGTLKSIAVATAIDFSTLKSIAVARAVAWNVLVASWCVLGATLGGDNGEGPRRCPPQLAFFGGGNRLPRP